MDWLEQDVIIKNIESKMNELRNAAYIAEKGMEIMPKNTIENIEKHIEFKIRLEAYTMFADFLEEILLDINCIKEEEIKQLEDAENDLRDKKYEAKI